MELVSKSAAAVAVSDELTTLIDWTNIEAVSGFTCLVENAGGGGGDNIIDVQIDTSADGGVTSQLDQFPALFASPIASGASKKETLTTSVKFVRVRAKCGNGNNTTANAWLMADSTVGRICTLADVKDRLGITTTEDDSLINRIITGLDSFFESFTNRKLALNATDETLYWTGNGTRISLPRYPIASITSIKESIDFDFDNTDTLVEDEDYRMAANGRMLFRIGCAWSNYEDSIEIKYRGGYVSAGQTPAAGQTAMPADLREAAIEQASFIYKRKHDIGLSAQSFDGGSINKFSEMNLLPMVAAILDNYKRLIL